MDESQKYFLQPGYIFVSTEPYMIHTVLGSCVAICIWDSVNRFGGMNHYIYAIKGNEKDSSAKFGDISIHHLIYMMTEMGSKKCNLRAHIIGGAQNIYIGSFIGKENVEIAKAILAKNKIPIVSEDTGGTSGRKVVFDSQNGQVFVTKVQSSAQDDWYIGNEKEIKEE